MPLSELSSPRLRLLLIPGLLAVLLLPAASCAVAPPAESASPPRAVSDLVGEWDVLLFYDPDAPPSRTSMVIRSATDGELIGEFYSTPFSTGRAIVRQDTIIFGAVTSDGTGPYWHSGRLMPGGEFLGQTLSAGRGFVMPWQAVRHSTDDAAVQSDRSE